LILTGDADVMTPLDGVSEVFSRNPSTKRLLVLAGADHLHFLDEVDGGARGDAEPTTARLRSLDPPRCARSPSYACRSRRKSLPAPANLEAYRREEAQALRDDAVRALRERGVDTRQLHAAN
jgi:hypothetical protein